MRAGETEYDGYPIDLDHSLLEYGAKRGGWGRVLPNQLVLGIDPGSTTGLCLCRSTDGGRDFTIENSWIVPYDDRFSISRTLASIRPHHIVIENFRLYRHKAESQINNEFPSVRVIGAIEQACWDLEFMARLNFQMASELSGVQIREEHEGSIGKSEHHKDSYKHARVYILTHQSKNKTNWPLPDARGR